MVKKGGGKEGRRVKREGRGKGEEGEEGRRVKKGRSVKREGV